MAFSIKKSFSIQTYFLHAPSEGEKPKDSALRASEIIERARRVYPQEVADILCSPEFKDPRQKYSELGIENRSIQSVFIKNPMIWSDLLVALHTNQDAYNIDKRVLIENKSTKLREDIYPLFIRYNAEQEDENSKITPEIIDQEILQNKKLFTYSLERSKNNRSMVEFPTSKFRKLNVAQIEGLIRTILIRNGLSEKHVERDFRESFQKVFANIESIFRINVSNHIGSYSNLNELAKNIRSAINTRGFGAEVGAEIIRCLYTWGDTKSIEKRRDEALAFLGDRGKNMSNILKQNGILFSANDVKITQAGSDEFYSVKAQCVLENNDVARVTVSWRVKSIRSILVKLRSDIHYSNADALRDMIGVSFVPEGTLDDATRKMLVEQTAKFYQKWTYIQKDKGLINTTPELTHTPIFLSHQKKGRTSSNYTNASQSGFIRKMTNKGPTGNAIGFEVQHFRDQESADPRGDADHYILDAKKIIEGWIRGAKFITREQALAIIDQNIPQLVRQERGIPDSNTLLETFLSDGTLLKYTMFTDKRKRKSESLEVLVWKGRTRAFEKEFPYHESGEKSQQKSHTTSQKK